MTTVVAVGRRYLPRGWADLGRQLAIWLGFALVYQIVRGLVDRKPPHTAFAHGLAVVRFETDITHRLYELTLRAVRRPAALARDGGLAGPTGTPSSRSSGWRCSGSTSATHDEFYGFRNSILLANVLGLFGYFFLPTAPPRMLGLGFIDQHRDGLVQLLANPYAAMPSLHAADALIVGVVLFSRLQALVVEGALGDLAGLGVVRGDGDRQPLLARLPRRARSWRCSRWRSSTARPSAALSPLVGRNRPPVDAATGCPPATLLPSDEMTRAAAIKHGYTTGARTLATRSVGGLARTRITPNALTRAASCCASPRRSSCSSSASNEILFYWLGRDRVRRRLGARHPRRRARPGGREDDAVRRVPRLDDRPGERGLHAHRRSRTSSRGSITRSSSRS